MIAKRFVATILFLAACAAMAPARSRAEVVEKIAVVVNNEVITQGEIDRLLAPLYQQYKSLYPSDRLVKKLDEARQAVIAQLIDEKLILGEAKKRGVEVSEKEIDAKIDETQKRFASKEMLERALAEQHLSLKELREKFKEQIMTRKLVDAKIGMSVIITPPDVAAYYEKHASEFVQPEEVKVRNILIKRKPEMTPEKLVQLVRDIEKRLKEGGDFAELAKLYSDGPGAADGGLMGTVRRGDLLPEIENVIFGMKEGETSGIIRSSAGYHFFRIEERRDSRTLSLTEARKFIEEAIYREKAREKMKGWLDGLKRSAYIAFK